VVRNWFSSPEGIGWTSKLVSLSFAVLAAVGGLVKAAGGSDTVAILFAAIGVVGAVLALGFGVLQKRAEGREAEEEILHLPAARVRDLSKRHKFYDLGVDTESPAALAELGLSNAAHAPYLERDVDQQLRSRMRDAARRSEPTSIVVSGPSKAGKSRTLAEAVVATLPDAWLLAPGDEEPRGAFVALARGKPPKKIRSGPEPCVIWLDDIEPYVGGPSPGLSPETIEALRSWRRPVVIAGTAGGKGVRSMSTVYGDATTDLLRRYPPVRLQAELTERERARLTGDAEVRAIGEFMISADELIKRYEHGSDCPEGVAVTRAAIDWRRMGLVRPIDSHVLEQLYGIYLNGPASPPRFERGLLWATTPLYAHTALLQGRDPYEPYDYIASYEQGPIPAAMWTAVIDEHATPYEQHIVGIAADSLGATEMTERAFRRGDEAGDAGGAFNLAVLLRNQGDFEGAEAAERRGQAHASEAIERGKNESLRRSLGYAQAYKQRGDLHRAIALYRLAVSSTDEDVAAAAREALERLEA
jgi:hypothetical protein